MTVLTLEEDLHEMGILGGAVAMKGKNCVAIAADHGNGGHSTNSNEKIFAFGSHLYLSFTGLAADARSAVKTLKFRSNIYELTEGRKITPRKLSALLTNVLYEKRFGPYLTHPIVAGLEMGTWEPFICRMDVIGNQEKGEFGYVAAGTCGRALLGMCEMLWEPNMSPSSLFESISQTLINSCNQDPRSGSGATVYIIEKNKVTIKTLKM